MSLLGELKRRKVFQVAAVYAVMAWLIIQIIDIINDPLNLPGWLDTVVIVLLAVGFPVAMVLAWAFDLTPQEWAATYDLLQRAKALLDAAHHPEGYNLGWNVGYIGGQDISHAHLHVIPRFGDEPHAGKGIRYWLKQADNKRPG